MIADWFFERLRGFAQDRALAWGDESATYAELLEKAQQWRERFLERGVKLGSVVAIEGGFSPQACSAFLALLGLGAVIVPLTPLMRAHRDKFLEIAEVQLLVELDEAENFTLSAFDRPVTNALTRKLQERGHPGLVIFSSGSTGAPKAILHDLVTILEKFRKVRQKKTTLTFLLFDHIGGIDTMLNAFGSGGTIVTVPNRTPEIVARAIERHKVHTLPTSPTFLNLFLISGVWEQRDLSSLQVIAYGTEPMPQSTLSRLNEVFPGVALVQTYGMSELGVLRSRSRDNQSLWIKFTGEGFETKVVDGKLWVKAETAMLGYLNAPDLFTDLINVGGQKVYPAEVENLLLQLDNVKEVAVFGKPHPMMGHIVAARFNLKTPEPLDVFKRRMNAFCRGRIANFQIPVFVELVDDEQFGARFKKMRHE